ncbi:MAG TPA: hypothetical protein VG167_01860, partial [Verrucomicrobiae bacterium]|nr:hypothetical protein [Verrucomicrobiae bacterium]
MAARIVAAGRLVITNVEAFRQTGTSMVSLISVCGGNTPLPPPRVRTLVYCQTPLSQSLLKPPAWGTGESEEFETTTEQLRAGAVFDDPWLTVNCKDGARKGGGFATMNAKTAA